MKRILLIEDDPNINQNIREALSAENYEVESVYDGLLGERLLKKNEYDCVILDVNLPGRTGYELCRDYRKHNITTPVLMLTAFDEIEDKVQGFESGADDYLTKPFYTQELILRIQSLMRRVASPKSDLSTPLVSGDLVIYQGNKKVLRNNTEILLTPREYQILVRLVLSKGEIVTKKELIDEIWGRAFDANTNTIEVYINFLRKKIDKPFGKDSIRTKIGFGYYFENK